MALQKLSFVYSSPSPQAPFPQNSKFLFKAIMAILSPTTWCCAKPRRAWDSSAYTSWTPPWQWTKKASRCFTGNTEMKWIALKPGSNVFYSQINVHKRQDKRGTTKRKVRQFFLHDKIIWNCSWNRTLQQKQQYAQEGISNLDPSVFTYAKQMQKINA